MSTTPKNIKAKKEDNKPEHNPAIPIDRKREKQKKELRDKAKLKKKKYKGYNPIITLDDRTKKYVSELTVYEQEEEYLRCATDPIYFIQTYLRIFDQTKGEDGEIVPFILFEDQKRLIDIYRGNRFVVANKYRQAGISTTTCAYIAWYVMFNKNRSVAIVADKLDTARDELMSDVVDFIESCPNWMKPKTGKPKDGGKYKDTQKLKRYDNDCELGAFSSRGLRGYTPTLLFWDETAWTEKADVFWTSAKPTLQTGGRAIMVSTPSGLDPVFYKTFDGARKRENEFIAVELWWFNDPRYNEGLVWIKNKGRENEIRMEDEGWSNEKRIKLYDEKWEPWSPWLEKEIRNANGDVKKIAQEILCSFLGSGDNFIGEKYLKRIEEVELRNPLRQEFTDGNMWIFEDPLPGEDYIIVIDVSSGHGDDYSTINILKLNEMIVDKIIKKNGKTKKIKQTKHKIEQVAEYYGKLTPQQLGDLAYQYGIKYNNAYCVVDITGGYGAQTVERMIDIGYGNMHYSEINHKPSRDRLSGYIKFGQKTLGDGNVVNVDLIPGFFIGNNRGGVLLEMQRAIHLEDVIIRSKRLHSELKTFINVPGNRVADHKRSFHDDSIMGLACGIYTASFDMAKYKQDKGVTEKMIDGMMTTKQVEEYERKKGKKEKPLIPRQPRMTPGLQQHMDNNWLFKDLYGKK